jgi:Ca2+-binding EF-hand superfamily protein
VDLDIRVDGNAPSTAWNQFLDHLYDFFDRDGDGSLNQSECGRLPPLPLPKKEELALAFSALDSDNNGRVSRSEFKKYCDEHGGSPIVVRVEPPSAEDVRLSGVFREWFDEDHDSKFAPGELRRAVRTMSRFDLNEDGAVDLDELLGSAIPQPSQASLLTDGPSVTSGRSVRVQINLKETSSSVRVDEGTAKLIIPAGGSSASITRFRGPKCTWTLAIDTGRRLPNVKSAGDFLAAQFQNVLGDQTELTLHQIRQDPGLGGLSGLAPIADHNGDERLSLAELQSFIELVTAALRSQIWVTMTDRSGNLFGVLDANMDGRLGVLELAQVTDVLGVEETIQALPQQFQITLGAAPIRSWGGMLVPSLPKQGAAPVTGEPTGPKWFQALDRNRDGIVSGREFVGPPEAFERLDSNRDGMISRAEAISSVAR